MSRLLVSFNSIRTGCRLCNPNASPQSHLCLVRHVSNSTAKLPPNLSKLKYQDPFLLSSKITKLIKQDRFEDAWNLTLASPKVAQSTEVYNQLLKELAKEGRWKKSWKLFNKMKSQGLKPNNYTYSILMTSISKSDVVNARDIINQIHDQFTSSISSSSDSIVSPFMSSPTTRLPTICTNAYLLALFKHGGQESAYTTYQELIDRTKRSTISSLRDLEYRPDRATFTIMLTAYLSGAENKVRKGSDIAKTIWNDYLHELRKQRDLFKLSNGRKWKMDTKKPDIPSIRMDFELFNKYVDLCNRATTVELSVQPLLIISKLYGLEIPGILTELITPCDRGNSTDVEYQLKGNLSNMLPPPPFDCTDFFSLDTTSTPSSPHTMSKSSIPNRLPSPLPMLTTTLLKILASANKLDHHFFSGSSSNPALASVDTKEKILLTEFYYRKLKLPPSNAVPNRECRQLLSDARKVVQRSIQK
ncbi:hypothetical protein BKA69DRAFT_1067768 [Paraphysoderma sedebokerense]|nr:hypothetical protein BKA69DRAFT_1067682 [Paraphysoderma sedebokerense]KAI9142342.1 hypothetical protein BKA69DRAFT_1067768 [Paraphysoderma sedebokerense]